MIHETSPAKLSSTIIIDGTANEINNDDSNTNDDNNHQESSSSKRRRKNSLLYCIFYFILFILFHFIFDTTYFRFWRLFYPLFLTQLRRQQSDANFYQNVTRNQ